MKPLFKLAFVTWLSIVSTSAFAECIAELKCANSDRTLTFVHEISLGGEPSTDSSVLMFKGEKRVLSGTTLADDGDFIKAVPGEYVWSEILVNPDAPIYSLTPTTGVGEVLLTIVEKAKTRSKVSKRMSDGIETEKYSFKGTFTLWGEEGSKTKFSVSCKSAVSCD